MLSPMPLAAHEHAQSTQTATSTATASGYLDGGAYIADATLYDKFVNAAPDWLVAIVPLMIAAMFVCRGLAEVLLWVSRRTESKSDDRVYELLSQASYTLARVLSWVGVGVPKMLLIDKAERLAATKQETKQHDETAKPVSGGTDFKDGPSVN